MESRSSGSRLGDLREGFGGGDSGVHEGLEPLIVETNPSGRERKESGKYGSRRGHSSSSHSRRSHGVDERGHSSSPHLSRKHRLDERVHSSSPHRRQSHSHSEREEKIHEYVPLKLVMMRSLKTNTLE
jgi:hypothetical protein